MLFTNCALLVADFYFAAKGVSMTSLAADNQVDIIIDNPYFEGMVNQIYPSE